MKSMLIIDTPESCEECPLRSYSNLALWCTPLRKTKEEDDVCPLRPMPKKKNTLLTEHNLVEAIYENGWNDCLDEIFGEDETLYMPPADGSTIKLGETE